MGGINDTNAIKAVEKAMGKVSSMTKLCEQCEVEFEDVGKQLKVVEDAFSSCISEIDTLEKAAMTEREAIENISRDVEKSRTEFESVELVWKGLTDEATTVKHEYDEETHTLESIDIEFAEAKTEKKEAKKRKSANRKLLQDLERQETKLEKELETVRDSEERLRDENTNLEKQKSDLLLSINSLQNDQDKLQAHSHITSEIEKLKCQIRDLRNGNSDKQAQIQKYRESKLSLVSTTDQLASQQTQLVAEGKHLESENHGLSAKKAEMDRCFNSEKMSYIAAMDEWSKEKSRSHDVKTALTATSSDQHQQNLALDEQLKSISATISELNLNIDLAKKRLAADRQLQQRIKKRTAEIDSQIQSDKVQLSYTKSNRPTIIPNARPNKTRTLQLD